MTRVGGWSERLLEVLALLEARDPVAWIRSGGWQTTASVPSSPEDEEEER
jgi:60 kDa SS-A/Ro ribonucleoprotein